MYGGHINMSFLVYLLKNAPLFLRNTVNSHQDDLKKLMKEPFDNTSDLADTNMKISLKETQST